jgi:hypothetical protein
VFVVTSRRRPSWEVIVALAETSCKIILPLDLLNPSILLTYLGSSKKR